MSTGRRRGKRLVPALGVRGGSTGLVLDAMLESFALHEVVYDAERRPVDYRLLDCNLAFTRITGIAREAAVGRLASQLFGGSAPFLEVYARVAETCRPERFETDYPPLDLRLAISVVSPRAGTFATIASDVTERHRAVQLLRRYRLLAEHSHDIFLFVGQDDGRIVEVNSAALAAYRYSRQEMLGLTVLDLCEPAAREVTAARLAAASERGARFEAVHRRKDGSTFPVEVSAASAEQDGARLLVSIVHDVSERKRAEALVAQSERRYRLLAEHVHDVIWTLDLATRRFTYISPSITKLRGLSVEEALAEPLERSLTPESLARVGAVMARIGTPEEENPHTAVYDQPCKDGSLKHVEITTVVVRDPAHRPVEVVGVSRDATARVDAQEALRKSEERFRALIERSSEMIQVLDERGRYSFWSQNATEAIGWTDDEIQGRSALELVHEEDRRRLGGALERLLAAPGAIARESYRFRHKDGTWRRVESVARNLLHDPAVRGVVINSRDVTAQRLLEEQFQQAQKLESVGRLAGGVAHDFNNILTVILGGSEALQEKLGSLDAEGQEELEEIRAAGERARDLTGQLLAFARKRFVAPVALDLNEIVRRNQRMLARMLGEDVVLQTELAPGLWTIHADPGQVEQVLMNLAVNARDAMPRGGTLLVATRNGCLAEAGAGPRPGEWVQLVVSDTGTGMSPEVQAHMFEPFFTTKELGKGTGLGLASVYGIVTQAGGHIEVRSEVGRGTTFQLCFARLHAPAAQASPPQACAREPARGSERVLVVEDDPGVRALVVRALGAEGYRVTAMGSPHQALALGREELDDARLLVTDVVMPGIDGHALSRELARRRPGLRVLYLSGYTRDAISERGVLDRGAVLLDKPFSRSALLARVRELLDAR
jgi:two-component system, cell cycle sensor histidine kinase and response regulator CckA